MRQSVTPQRVTAIINVTQEEGTERPYQNEYHDSKEAATIIAISVFVIALAALTAATGHLMRSVPG